MPRLLLVLAASLWSLSGAMAKYIALPGPSMAAYRALFAGIFLAFFVRRRRIRWRPALFAMLACFTLMNVCYLTAMTLTSAANAILLQCTAPVWSTLACLLWLGEKLDRRSLVSIAIALVGMAFIAGGGWSASPLGISLALASGIFYGLLTVFLRYLRNEDPTWLTCLNHLGAGLILLPVLFLPGQAAPWNVDITIILALAVFGVVQMGTPYLLYAKALRSVSPQEAGVITLVEPVLNPIITYLVVSEVPTRSTLVGGAIVLGAVGLRYLPVPGRRRKRVSTQPPHLG